MLLKPITNDNLGPDLFNIGGSSTNPKLQLGGEDVKLIPEDKIQSYVNYLQGTLTEGTIGILDAEGLQNIVIGFVSNWNRFRTEDINYQVSNTKTYVESESGVVESSPHSSFTKDEQTSLMSLASSLGYLTVLQSSTTSTRKSITSSSSSFTKVLSESVSTNENRAKLDTDKKDTYLLVEKLINLWTAIQEASELEGEVHSFDMEISSGSSAPTPLTGYKRITGTLVYVGVDNNMYKEGFSIESEETCVTLDLDGIQVLWTNPSSDNSIVKLLWDSSRVQVAKLTEVKLHKYNK